MNQFTHPPALAHWHRLMQARNTAGLHQLLADDVVFYSPVVGTPQVGKPITSAYLSAAMHVFGNETFKYVREVVGSNDAVLEFELVLDGIRINGVDMLRWNAANQLTEFKVMLRPLKAVNIIHQKMGEMLAKMQG
jgi:ketosteroid isomerase-like protein